MADNIIRLKLDSSEYQDKLKRAVSGLQQYEQGCRRVGGTLEVVEKETLDYVKSIGRMETVSKSAKGRVSELSTAFVELKSQYNRLTEAEKQSPYGKELSKSLEQLKTRIRDTKKELNDINKEMNGGNMGGGLGNAFSGLSLNGLNMSSIMGDVGGSLGLDTTLLAGLTAGTLGLAGAIAAAAAAASEGAQAFKAYNDELARQEQITSVTTGLHGKQAEAMTAEARAISDVYGTDFREVINAANTLMTQFGKSGDEAMQLIRDGMQGMIMGDGGKLLSMIKQYAPAFRDAGVSAEQLVAVIHNSEGGIFTDENMNAIVMGIKNIRLMTKSTSDALRGLGIDGEKMTHDLNDGTITIFEALQKVSGAIENVDSNSQDAGQVMQQVFGRQGVTAGSNLGKAIKELNLNLEETKRQTGSVGESFNKLVQAQTDLEKAMQKAFGVDGWEQLCNVIEYGVTEALAGLVSLAGSFYDVIHEIGNALGGPVTEFAIRAALALSNPLMMAREILKAAGMWAGGDEEGGMSSYEKDQRATTMGGTFVGAINRSSNKTAKYSEIMAQLNKTLDHYQEIGDKENADLTQRVIDYVDKRMDEILFNKVGATGVKGGKKIEPKTTPTTKTDNGDEFTDVEEINGLIQRQTQLIADLNRMKSEAWKEEDIAKYNRQIKEANDEIQRLNGLGVKPEVQLSPLQEMNNELKKLRQELEMSPNTETYKEKLQEIADLEKQIKEFKGESTTTTPSKQKSNNRFLRYRDDGKSETNLMSVMSGVAGSINQMASGIEALGIELPSGLKDVVNGIQGVMSILTAISTIVSAIQAITTADAIIPFSNGGIVHAAGGFVVPGNYNSGDLVPAALSSGEVVLNRAQQGVIANALQQEPRGGGNGLARVSGEQIWVALNAFTKRTGKGELVTWK